MAWNPRGVPNIRPGLRFAQTMVGPLGNPLQAANLNIYKTTRRPGPYSPPVPAGVGSAHSPTGGPNAAAALANYMNQQRAIATRNKFGGRFDQRGFFRRNQFETPRRRISEAVGGAYPRAALPLYPPDSIRRMTNRAVDDAFTMADMRNAQKRFAGRGLSMDEGTQAAAAPMVAGALSQAAQASMVNPLFDYLDNQRFALQQQDLRNQQLRLLLGLT